MRIRVEKHRDFENTRLDACDPLSALRDAVRILEPFEAFTDAGTLVGLYRDGRFIPHDYDVDFGVIGDWEKPGKIASLDSDFDPIRTITTGEGRPMQKAYIRDKVIVDLYFSWTGLEPGIALNKTDVGVIRTPLTLIRPLGAMSFEGVGIRVPAHTEDYLRWRYGPNWRTPIPEKISFPEITPALEKE